MKKKIGTNVIFAIKKNWYKFYVYKITIPVIVSKKKNLMALCVCLVYAYTRVEWKWCDNTLIVYTPSDFATVDCSAHLGIISVWTWQIYRTLLDWTEYICVLLISLLLNCMCHHYIHCWLIKPMIGKIFSTHLPYYHKLIHILPSILNFKYS